MRTVHGLLTSLVLCFSCLGAARAFETDHAFGGSDFNPGNALIVNGDLRLSSSHSGWINGLDMHEPGNQNYYIEYCECEGVYLYNNWFSFDIASLSGTHVSTLAFTVFRYYDVATRKPYTLYDFSGPLTALYNNSLQVPAGTFTDLGSGHVYGSGDVVADAAGFVTISLNATAIADLNAAIARGDAAFIIGGTLAPVAVVPEPPVLVLALCGMGLLLLRRPRAKRLAEGHGRGILKR